MLEDKRYDIIINEYNFDKNLEKKEFSSSQHLSKKEKKEGKEEKKKNLFEQALQFERVKGAR